MIDFYSNSNHVNPSEGSCTGCGACLRACHHNAIQMKRNNQGFCIAYVDEDGCRNCGACSRVCPFEQGLELRTPLAAYAFRLSDTNELIHSSSGGAFYALAESVIDAGGYVCSAIDDCSESGRFLLTGHLNDVKAMRGSKYYYIDLDTEVVEQIKKTVKDSKVLFCGLPCQVHAIKRAVGKNNNLIAVDLLCQGAPSSYVVKSYRKQEESRREAKLLSHTFRSKRYGVDKGYIAELVFDSGDIENNKNDLNLYNCSFAHKLFLREACYNCSFARLDRAGDISIGDFWGLKSFAGGSPDKEVSLVLLNKPEARYLMDGLSSKGTLELHTVEEAVAGNAPLNGPCKRPFVRSVSYWLLKRLGFRAATAICYPKYFVKRIVFRSS